MEKKVSRKDLLKSFLTWIFFNQMCYNYERMQGLAVCWSMVPVIDSLHSDPEKRKEILTQELSFFNTEVTWGACILGLAAGMQEQYANGSKEITPESITAVKSGLMGPFAGIGDTITQGIFLPLIISVCISMTLEGNPTMGPVLLLVLGTVYKLGIGYTSWFLGHDKGSEVIFQLLESGAIHTFIEAAGVVGCTVMGALIAQYVSLNLNINIATEYSTFNLQADFLDKLCPKILPLLLTLLCYRLIKKQVKPAHMLLILFVIGMVGKFIGIF